MFSAYLNVDLVEQLRREKGVSVKWLISYLNLRTTTGYVMFREGVLPKTFATRKAVLAKLGAYLGVDQSQLTLKLSKSA